MTLWNGHINIGPITIYGNNAMDWAVNVRTKKWGYICFTLPTLRRFKTKLWYFYLSPNATPWACTYYLGHSKSERIRSQIRKLNFGHGFKYTHNSYEYAKLMALNRKFDSMFIHEFDVNEHAADLIGLTH